MSSHGSLGEERVLVGQTLLVLIRDVTEYNVNALHGYKEMSIIQMQERHLL